MILVQQVIATVIVDLEVAHIELVGVGVPLRELAEDVRDGPGDDSTIRISLSATCDGEGLSWTSLAISENRAIETFEAWVNYLR